jgi:plasmid stabilization system protein ParE
MSLPVVIALRAEQDMTLQHQWYLENASVEVAERYLMAVDQTIQRLAVHPELGLSCHFQSMELARIRSLQAARPFDKHLVFYQIGEQLSIERIMHGSRDLPRRLLEDLDR